MGAAFLDAKKFSYKLRWLIVFHTLQYCSALFLLDGFWDPEIYLECVDGWDSAPDPAGELTTLPQAP